MSSSSTAARTDPLPPLVDGYRVGRLLGRGGSADVWQGTRLRDRTPVALKVLREGRSADQDREVRVRHARAWPQVVPCHEVVHTDDGRRVLVLALLAGGTVGSLVSARGHLSPGEAVTLVVPLLRGLAALHAAGVVHGDIAPGNVLLSRHGEPFLSDLGSASLVGEQHEDLWATDGFVAPEVLAGQAPEAAADLFAVGALLWLCLTGRPPGLALARPPLADVDPGLPEPLRALVEACLDEHPAARPEAALLAGDLCDLVDPEPLDLRSGDDELALITHRLRAPVPARDPVAEAIAQAEREAAAAASSWRSRLGGARSRPREVRRPPGGRQPRHGAERRGGARPVRLVAAVTAVVFAVLLGAAGWWLQRPDAPATAAPPSRPSPATTVDGGEAPSTMAAHTPSGASPTATAAGGRPPSASSSSAAPAAVLMQRDAPVRRPSALMQALADARAAAYVSTSVQSLHAVDLPASPAWQQDADALSRMRAAGARYVDLRLDVRQASGEPERGGRSRVTALVATAPYAVHQHGSVARRPGDGGRPVVVHLHWGEHGWRVERVSAPAG